MRKNRMLLIMGIVVLISAIACGMKDNGKVTKNTNETVVESTQKKGEYKKISSEEAKKIMETEKNYKIIDVRSLEEYNEGHIPNAISLPIENIGAGKLEELADKNQLILVYCRSGNRSR